MYTPSIEQIKKLAKKGNLIPVYREISADLETPVSAYLKIAKPPYSFLLESVEGENQIARYSFIGTEPYDVIKTGHGQKNGPIDPLVPIQDALSSLKVVDVPNVQRFNGGAVGYLSYEAASYFEKLPVPTSDPLGLPESIFMLTTTFLVFDHLRHKIRIVSHAHLNGDIDQAYADAIGRIDDLVKRLKSPIHQTDIDGEKFKTKKTKSNLDKNTYNNAVERIIDYIHSGDCIQVVFSQRFSRETDANPLDIYRSLRSINPSPYMFYLSLDNFQILGASPEMLVRCTNGHLDYHPIAGTRRRGKTPEEDIAMDEELRKSEKDIAEHIMLLDLGRNDVGRVSKTGTVNVTQIMDIERYSHVMHLVSHITGELKDSLTSYDALRACFPAGTLSGAPKIRAMEIIAELEPDKRGPYGGAIGYFDLTGNMDTAIGLRTMVVKDGIAHIQAGGGIVSDSKTDEEYQETIDKSSALIHAIDQAEIDEAK